MAERPILFSAPMVLALLAGTKTQTRRIFKITGPMGNKCEITSPDEEIVRFEDGTFHYLSTSAMSGPYPCPYGVPGDRLWVRENHSLLESSITGRAPRVWYWADGNPTEGDYTRPRPSIHMHRWASRITLQLTDVRVERLQQISSEDAAAEGWPGPDEANSIRSAYPIAWYSHLWESINGKNSWAVNPWLWVLTFKRVDPTSNEQQK